MERRVTWSTAGSIWKRCAATDALSGFQPRAASLLRLIGGSVENNAHIIDIGGATSALVNDLLPGHETDIHHTRRPRSRNLSIVTAGASNHA